MSKNIIILILIVAVIALGGVLAFSNIQNKSGLQPRILVSEEEWDFGKVIQGEKPTHIFIVKNEGEGDLIVESIKVSCGCIEASITTSRIRPGESAELKVSYDTTNYVGKDSKYLNIYSNDPEVPDKRIDLYVETEVFQIPNLIPKTNTSKSETQTQIIKNITPRGAYNLIQENKDNPNFVILDVSAPAKFLDEYIENAVNLSYWSAIFGNDLDKLDKNKTYLVYCRAGGNSEKALNMMKELDFKEAYNMLGGINKWKSEELPTTK